MARRRVEGAKTKPTTMSRNGRKPNERALEIARLMMSDEYQALWEESHELDNSLDRIDRLARMAAMEADWKMALAANREMLPYQNARKEPEPPAPTARVEAEPLDLDDDDWKQQFSHGKTD